MIFRHFVHLAVLEKYRYGENSVAKPNYKKSHYPLKVQILVYKMLRAFFKRISKFAFCGGKSTKLATLVYTNVFVIENKNKGTVS
jgi:hypothetical protein